MIARKSQKNEKKQLSTSEFFRLYDEFIAATLSGKRLNANGSRIRKSSVTNYYYTRKVLAEFFETSKFNFRLPLVNKLTKRELKSAKFYWKRFYDELVNYCYLEKDYSDNYTGTIIKSLKTFFSYHISEGEYNFGYYFKSFYVPHDEQSFLVLSPDQFSQLINSNELNSKLDFKQRMVRDVFCFGCTVGLRVSDLFSLKSDNIVWDRGGTFVQIKTSKTGSVVRIKLPDYAVSIVKRYYSRRRRILFPRMSLSWFNIKIKELGYAAGWVDPVIKVRTQKGAMKVIYKDKKLRKHYRFYELMSSHIMRRTGITTLLRLGVPELVVRKFSGHAAGSKEFYRYISVAQSYMNHELDQAFERLSSGDVPK